MKIKKLLLLLLFVSCYLNGFSYRLSGIITDQNNEPIPYVIVYINKTTTNVSSNIKGEYYMELNNGNYEIVFYNLGFEKKTIPVSIEGKNTVLNVKLSSSVKELSEVTINASKEDPAYAVIRNAIKAKDKYKNIADEYSCKAYIKSSLEKEYLKKGAIDTLTNANAESKLTKERMNFLESYSTVYYHKPDKIKEIKEAYNDLSESQNTMSFSISVNNNSDASKSQSVTINLFKTRISEADFNFYKNLLLVPSLSTSPIVSPLHYATFISYKFRLEEYFYEDGLWINKIAVIPKRTDASLVSGYIYIVDSLWSIKAVNFTVDPFTLNYFNYFRIIQNYTLVNNTNWVLSQEEFFNESKEGKETILGNTIIKYSDYNLKPELRKNFFDNEISVITDEAYERDSLYWAKIRPITLKEDEYKFIVRIDSVDDYRKSPEYMRQQDSIANKLHFYELLFGKQFQNSFKKEQLFLGGQINSLLNSLFPVGNFRLVQDISYKKEFRKGYEFEPSGTIKYGFKNKDVRGNVRLSYTYLPKRFGKMYIEYKNDYGVINEYQSFTTALTMSNYINDVGYVAGHEIEIFNGAFLDIQAEHLEKKPLNLNYDDWYVNSAKTEEDKKFLDEYKGMNFRAFTKFSIDITLKYIPFQKYRTEPYKKINLGSKYPTIAFNYRKGIPGIFNSIANYDFLEIRIWDDMRFGSFGESRWKIYTGKFLNSASLRFTENKFFRMSDNWYFSNPLRSFQLLDTSLSTFNEYFEVHYMHSFEGKLLNKIPVIKKLHLLEVGGGGILLINDRNFSHAELFAGIEKPFTLWKQRFKLGCYYVVSDSNYSKVSGLVKFGISMFDPFTNTWNY